MRTGHYELLRAALVASLVTLLSSCGGNSLGGGTHPPPSGKEVLYAANTANSIFSFEIDQTSGDLTQMDATIPGGSSVGNSDLVVSPHGFLYAANNADSEINGYALDSSGGVSLLPASPFLVQPASAVITGFSMDSSGKFLYASNQSGFGVLGFTIDSSTGALTEIPGGPFACPGVGGPPVKTAVDPNGRFLYASASFDDVFLPPGYNIWAFTIDSQTGVLTPIPGAPFATLGGAQPYGLKVDPSGKFLYVALSNSNSIAAFSIDGNTGVLTVVPGSPFATSTAQFTQTYELAIAPSGQFLYAFNFNGNTVAAFTINSTSGALTAVAGSPFSVTPNAEGGLIVDPSGQFLYLTIGFGPPSSFVIFDINPTTGALSRNRKSPVNGSQEPFGLAVAHFQ